MANIENTASILPGERIDHLAYRLLGDPKKYDLLLLVNPNLDPWDPIPGNQIVVPDVE
jgi:hypothetical protein